MAVDWTIKPYDLSQTVGAFSQGFLTPFVASNQMRESQMKQQQMEEAKRKQTALNQYQQTGDPNVLRGVDPQMAAKLQDWINTRPPEELTKLAKVTQYLEATKPFVAANPAAWGIVRDRAISMGADEKMLPPPNATPEMLNQLYWGTQTAQAQLKSLEKGPQVYKPGETVVDPVSGKAKVIPYGEKELADIEHKKTDIKYKEKLTEDPFMKKEPHVFENLDTGEKFQTHYGDPRVTQGNVREYKPGMTSLSDIDEIVKGIGNETIPPTMPSKRGVDYNTTIARARRLGINLQEKTLKFDMLKDQAKHLASNQTELFITSAREMGSYADKVIRIAQDMDLGPMRLWNWGKIKYLAEVGGNSPEAIKAREYVSAVVSAKALLARIDSTGFAPTTDAWKVAHEQLDEKLPVGQVTAQISTIRDMTNYRLEAINDMRKDALSGKTEIPLTKGNEGKNKWQDSYERRKAAIMAYPDGPEKEEELAELERIRKAQGF